MVARLARRLARGSRFGGLDAPPLALLGGSAFGLGCGRAAAVAWPPSVVDALGHVLARPGPAHVVGGVGLHLDGELGLRYAAAAAFVTQRVRAVRGCAHEVIPVYQVKPMRSRCPTSRSTSCSDCSQPRRDEGDECEDHDAHKHPRQRAAPPRALLLHG